LDMDLDWDLDLDLDLDWNILWSDSNSMPPVGTEIDWMDLLKSFFDLF
jgi:hypothetical protein